MHQYIWFDNCNKVLLFNMEFVRIVDMKETMVKTHFNDFSNSLHKEMLNILKDYISTKNKILKYGQDIKNRQKRFLGREKIASLNKAKKDFMIYNDICFDVQRLFTLSYN